jgi:molybdate transport system regulatory protein
MNRLEGVVAARAAEGGVSLVEVDVGGAVLSALTLEAPDWLAPGCPAAAVFKESEVALAAGPAAAALAGLSIRNRLPCTVRAVRAGRILAHVELDWRGKALHALISARSCADLALAPGMPVVALIKSTEVALAESDAA